MSRHDDLKLEDLLRDARAERSSQRWEDQRDVFRRLRIGGGAELFAARIAHAAASSPRRLALGALGGTLVPLLIAGATFVIAPAEEAGAPPERTTPSVTVAPPLAPRAETSPGVSEPVIMTSADALPAAPPSPSAPSAPPRERRASASSRTPGNDLAKELASVSNIRAQVGHHEYAAARHAIRAHRATFTHGALAQEVSILEIETLRGLGDDRERCHTGKAFLDAHASSAYRERVLSLTSDCKEQPSPGASHDESHSSP